MTCALGQILFSAVSQLPSVCAQMNDHWLWVYIYCTDVVVSSLSTTTVMVFFTTLRGDAQINTSRLLGYWHDNNRSSQIPHDPAGSASTPGDRRRGGRGSRGPHHHHTEPSMPTPHPYRRPPAGKSSLSM